MVVEVILGGWLVYVRSFFHVLKVPISLACWCLIWFGQSLIDRDLLLCDWLVMCATCMSCLVSLLALSCVWTASLRWTSGPTMKSFSLFESPDRSCWLTRTWTLYLQMMNSCRGWYTKLWWLLGIVGVGNPTTTLSSVCSFYILLLWLLWLGCSHWVLGLSLCR